jgi:neprilysin
LNTLIRRKFDKFQISLPNDERLDADALYNPMNLTELQKEYPYVNWLTYINNILPKEVHIKDDEVINVSVKSFFKDLGQILENTPKRTMANYAMWRITEFSTYFLPEIFRKRQLEYHADLYGVKDSEPRWKECVDITIEYLPISVGALYVRHFFPEDAKKAAIEIAQNIREAFENILKTVEWMDAITREKALDKVKTLATHIGYPDELTDNKKLEDYYKGLEINSDNYLETNLRLTIFLMDKSFLKLRKPINKTDWTKHSKVANVIAKYFILENSISEYMIFGYL